MLFLGSTGSSVNQDEMASFSNAQERRVATLASHLRESAVVSEEGGRLEACPTMAALSVFENIQQAPEDPILGVSSLSIFFKVAPSHCIERV